MNRMIVKQRTWLLAAVLAAAAPAAFADADPKCMSQWNDAVAAEGVGDVCKVGDPASMAGFKAAEDAAVNCIVSKMSAQEAADFRANAAKTKVAIAKQMAAQPCPAQAKAYYQQRSLQLPAATRSNR